MSSIPIPLVRLDVWSAVLAVLLATVVSVTSVVVIHAAITGDDGTDTGPSEPAPTETPTANETAHAPTEGDERNPCDERESFNNDCDDQLYTETDDE